MLVEELAHSLAWTGQLGKEAQRKLNHNQFFSHYLRVSLESSAKTPQTVHWCTPNTEAVQQTPFWGQKTNSMSSNNKLMRFHETCYAGASWEMSMQYPFMMAIKRSEPWWASLLEDDVMPHYRSPHLSLRQLRLSCAMQWHGPVLRSLRLLPTNVSESINSPRVPCKCPRSRFISSLIEEDYHLMPVTWTDGGGTNAATERLTVLRGTNKQYL